MSPATLRSLVAALFVTLLAACSSSAPRVAPVDPLKDTRWILVAPDATDPETPPADTAPTLAFVGGLLEGNDGCNRFRGSYRLNGKRLQVGEDIISTRIACPEAVMTQANAFLAALAAADGYRLGDERLQLFDADGKFLAEFRPQRRDLSGSTWSVTGYNNGSGGVVSTLIGTEMTAQFGSDGRVAGSAGCNAWSATYQRDGATIRIGATAAARRHCPQPDGVMEQERRFLAAVQRAASWRVDGNRLELRAADGSLLVSFVLDRP